MSVPHHDVRIHREPCAQLAPRAADRQRRPGSRCRRGGRRGHERPRGRVLLHRGGARAAHVIAAHPVAPGHGAPSARRPRVPEAARQRRGAQGLVRPEQQPRRGLGGVQRAGLERRIQLEQLVVGEQQLLAGLGGGLGALRVPGGAHPHSCPAAALVQLGLSGHLTRQHKDVPAEAPQAVPALGQLSLPAGAVRVRAGHGVQGARVPDAQGARRHQEVPEGVRHGAPGPVVHAVQVEEGVHALWRLGLPVPSLLPAVLCRACPTAAPVASLF